MICSARNGWAAKEKREAVTGRAARYSCSRTVWNSRLLMKASSTTWSMLSRYGFGPVGVGGVGEARARVGVDVPLVDLPRRVDVFLRQDLVHLLVGRSPEEPPRAAARRRQPEGQQGNQQDRQSAPAAGRTPQFTRL